MGEVVWVGRGSLGASDGRISLYLRGDAPRLVPEPRDAPQSELHDRLRTYLKARGASFFRDVYNNCGGGDEDVMLDAVWDLVWAGEVTNDTFSPLRLLGPARLAGGRWWRTWSGPEPTRLNACIRRREYCCSGMVC
jgi:ATP-dependent Lhr-like helicase